MADLHFSSFAQPPIGQALQQADTGGPLGPATFQPALTLVHPDGTTSPLSVPSLSVIGAGSAVGLEPRAVLRTDPPAGSGDVETTDLASVDTTCGSPSVGGSNASGGTCGADASTSLPSWTWSLSLIHI